MLIIAIILIILFFGGGFAARSNVAYAPYANGGFGIGALLILLLVLYLLGVI